ncbi:MAG: hypothetical protein OEZ36_09710 [Spirochaetota bacterium]|nr:hypothetical protein [Spirochaetota bacterium]
MKEVIQLVLEKVKSGALTVDEGSLILEKMMSLHSAKKSTKKGPCETVEAIIEPGFEKQLKDVFSRIFNEESLSEWEKVSDKMGERLKEKFRDWVNEEKD